SFSFNPTPPLALSPLSLHDALPILRAVLKAADLCATDPVGAAQTVVTKGYTREYDYAFPLIKSLPYDRWRAHNPEDSLRFYALRSEEHTSELQSRSDLVCRLLREKK